MIVSKVEKLEWEEKDELKVSLPFDNGTIQPRLPLSSLSSLNKILLLGFNWSCNV